MIDPEDPVLVAVEGDRLAPGLQIGAGRMEIGKGRLALDKLQMHQSAGRVVDKHQQGALRPTILEPPMLAAVDLNQFANTRAAAAVGGCVCVAYDHATDRLRSSTGVAFP